ncbi:MAG: hypothetical protein IJ833_02615 [Lachnospiraceae bacterium]|nr:hypothetical protein [Lachnospiraceae bacterium]
MTKENMMKEMLNAAAKGTRYEGNENELYIAICGDFRRRADLTKEQKVQKIAKRIFDMAMKNGYAV